MCRHIARHVVEFVCVWQHSLLEFIQACFADIVIVATSALVTETNHRLSATTITRYVMLQDRNEEEQGRQGSPMRRRKQSTTAGSPVLHRVAPLRAESFSFVASLPFCIERLFHVLVKTLSHCFQQLFIDRTFGKRCKAQLAGQW
jgi:hypothetical protein